MNGPKKIPIAERFWTKVDQSGDCWLWKAMHDKDGYGQISDRPKSLKRQAHRVAWELSFGPIPQGLRVLHSCDNPPCVRPEHLFLGTSDLNSKDILSKNRQARGSRQGLSKLTEDKVAEIKRRADEKMGTLATEFGVTAGAIWFIRKGLTWRHV